MDRKEEETIKAAIYLIITGSYSQAVNSLNKLLVKELPTHPKIVVEEEYEVLKYITGKNLFEAGACLDEMDWFVKKFGFSKAPDNFNYFLSIAYQRNWIDFLVLKGFIRKKVLSTFEPKDRFYIGSTQKELMLCWTKLNEVVLIELASGIKWSDPLIVNDPLRVTKEQLRILLGFPMVMVTDKQTEEIIKTKH